MNVRLTASAQWVEEILISCSHCKNNGEIDFILVVTYRSCETVLPFLSSTKNLTRGDFQTVAHHFYSEGLKHFIDNFHSPLVF